MGRTIATVMINVESQGGRHCYLTRIYKSKKRGAELRWGCLSKKLRIIPLPVTVDKK